MSAAILADIAEGQLGVVESPRGSNSGEAVRAYQAATNEPGTGWAWCAAYVCWCVLMLRKAHPTILPATLELPKTPAAFGFLPWARQNGCRVLSPGDLSIRRGDIAVFRFSHIGIVTRPPEVAGHGFESIEGNTDSNGSPEGWQVAIRRRQRSSVRKFIQLPI